MAVIYWLEARTHELSSKIGAVLAAVGGAAVAASALTAPWNYVVFGAALALVLFPEPVKA